MRTSAYRIIRQAFLGKKFEHEGEVYRPASCPGLTDKGFIFYKDGNPDSTRCFSPIQLVDLKLVEDQTKPREDSTDTKPNTLQSSGVFIDTEGKAIPCVGLKERRKLEAIEREYRQRRAIMDEQGD